MTKSPIKRLKNKPKDFTKNRYEITPAMKRNNPAIK